MILNARRYSTNKGLAVAASNEPITRQAIRGFRHRRMKHRLESEVDKAACEPMIRGTKVCFEFTHFCCSRFRFYQRHQSISLGNSNDPTKVMANAQASTSARTPLGSPHCAPRGAGKLYDKSALLRSMNDVDSDRLNQVNKRLDKQVKRGRYETDSKGVCVVCLHA
jgi:hypothetical protein